MIQHEVVRYYRQRARVENYERTRFGTIGGKLVDEAEKGIILGLSRTGIKEGVALDLGTGTGRVAALIQSCAKIGVDSSRPMLRKARRRKLDVVCSDLRYLPFKDGAFSATIALRVFIREDVPLPLFRESARVLEKGGCFVFDTSNKFSVGSLLNLLSQEPRHSTFSEKEVETMLRMSSFIMTQKKPTFILPRGIYQKFDSGLARILWKIEKALLRTKLSEVASTHFWKASLR